MFEVNSVPDTADLKASDPLAIALVHLHQAVEGESHLSLGRLLHAVGAEGPALAAALLALPFLQPIPLIGLSTPLGFTIGVLGGSLLLQREIKLPKRLSEARLPVPIILKTTDYLTKFERKLKPYLNSSYVFDSIHHRRVLGAAIAVHGFLLALPLPIPLSNMIPAWLCFVASLTILFSSRRLYFASLAIVLINVAFWTTLIIGTVRGSSSLVEWLGSILPYDF